jgi:uncharacterized protein YkwD
MVRFVRMLLATVVVVAITLAVTVSLGTVVAPAAQASDAGTILAGVNEARAAAGVPPLTLKASMSSVAGAWSQHLADSGRCPAALAHNPSYSAQIPDGWSGAGENVACNTPADPGGLETQWMSSAGHRANILDPAYTDIGIGVVIKDGVAWGTQDFATYPAAPAPAPAPVQAPKPAPAPVAKAVPKPAPAPAAAPAATPAPVVAVVAPDSTASASASASPSPSPSDGLTSSSHSAVGPTSDPPGPGGSLSGPLTGIGLAAAAAATFVVLRRRRHRH